MDRIVSVYRIAMPVMIGVITGCLLALLELLGGPSPSRLALAVILGGVMLLSVPRVLRVSAPGRNRPSAPSSPGFRGWRLSDDELDMIWPSRA